MVLASLTPRRVERVSESRACSSFFIYIIVVIYIILKLVCVCADLRALLTHLALEHVLHT